MPYIDQRIRDVVDPAIEQIERSIDIANVDGPTAVAGIFNYVISRLLVKIAPAKRYWVMALMIGTVICAIFEYYRRYVAPYEDEAIQKNGDIQEYK